MKSSEFITETFSDSEVRYFPGRKTSRYSEKRNKTIPKDDADLMRQIKNFNPTQATPQWKKRASEMEKILVSKYGKDWREKY